MRRYVYKNHHQCTCPTRREIREVVMNDMNERPQPMTEVRVATLPSMAAMRYDQMHYDLGDVSRMHRYIFETICFSTMIWVEEHVENGVSCGYYTVHNSYFQVPQGVDLPEGQLMNEGHSYHDGDTEPYRGLGGEAYYRYRMYQLEDRLRELERTRVILPREEIRDIHAGIAQVGNRPIKAVHFDEDIFIME